MWNFKSYSEEKLEKLEMETNEIKKEIHSIKKCKN